MGKGAGGTYRVDAAKELPQPILCVRIIQFRTATAAAREKGETKASEVAKSMPTGVAKRSHHRDLQIRQLQSKVVLFLDLRIAPAPGTIEFCHQKSCRFLSDLVDPVFIAVQCQE